MECARSMFNALPPIMNSAGARRMPTPGPAMAILYHILR